MEKRESPRGPPLSFAAQGPPGITDPAALEYQRAVEERRRTAPTPKGPPIPLLSGEAQAGRTMADQAVARPQPGSIFQEQQPRPAPAILPQDLLPDEATKDPTYQEGTGARYASSQPALAYKYGILRNGQRLVPQQLTGPRTSLSPATVEGLQAVKAFNETRDKAELPTPNVEADVAAGPAGAAAKFGAPDPLPTPKENASKQIQMDDFDFSRFRDAVMKDIINNDEQKKIIEKRLLPLSFDDLIVNNTITQVVPIIPGKFEPEFQSLQGDDDIALKRLIMAESKSIEVSERYLTDKFACMTVTAGLRAINKNLWPDHRDAQGNFSEELFWAKFNRVLKLNVHMLGALGVHFFWFEVRVRTLFVAEKLGNG